MQERVKLRKRAVNLSVDVALIDAAMAAGTNMSAVLEQALRRELAIVATSGERNERAEEWRLENAEAIKSWNEELESNGLWSDGIRTF